ncbi:lipopolysaccharide cholinephosphotransferase LicD1 [Floricoccus penangensis]|uniref:Lipopolysaccharide cholinephosphotransferase LicD1 n=1 Tax=Floricoccus penangensis TaxID=1859475 RepID=A0A9Q5JIE5_9LACT|nr:LicD family protein [Floricoccus penangensis]OFI47928.1 lipopolysaccharide cholinephosphotransferase LicD1 [Floricoccus penangensis]
MKKMTDEEVRDVQIEMLVYIDKFCRENDIEYSLGGGSLLGSIRHEGFIPWDDDIDIMLYRPEYEKFIKLMMDKINSDYTLLNFNVKKTLISYSKIYANKTISLGNLDKMHPDMGVYIDVFPMDKMPESDNERIKFMKKVQNQAENLLSTSFPEYVSGSKAIYAAARLFLRTPRFLLHHGKWNEQAVVLDNLMKTYEHTDVSKVGFTDSRYREKECFNKDIFSEYEDVSFEKHNVRKIKRHDEYLTQLYGCDYMELPPENKRVNHNYYDWYWKE